MLNQTGGSRMDTMFKLVLIFVISVLSFSIGAFVGKQVSDTEHREAMLETDMDQDRGTASIDPDATSDDPKSALSEEDIASLTEEFVNVEKEAIKKQEELPNPTDKAKKAGNKDQSGYAKFSGGKFAKSKESNYDKKKEKQKTVAKAAERVAKNMPPSKNPIFKRKPAAILPSAAVSSIGQYTVQVGSYATEQEAQNRTAQLKGKGYSAFYVASKVKTKTWYRVSVGLFANYKAATAFRAELKAEAGIKESFVQKIVK